MRTVKATVISILALGLLAGSAIGVGAQDEGTSGEATPFEGRWSYGSGGSQVSGVREVLPNGVITNRGQVWNMTSSGMSDPRLDGAVDNAWNWDIYTSGDRHTVWTGGFRIENEDGAWQMRPITNIEFFVGEYSVWTGIFDGEGDYEGLTAVAEVTEADRGFSLRGVIIEGEVPPAPESMPTE